jgi:hypothetical protein
MTDQEKHITDVKDLLFQVVSGKQLTTFTDFIISVRELGSVLNEESKNSILDFFEKKGKVDDVHLLSYCIFKECFPNDSSCKMLAEHYAKLSEKGHPIAQAFAASSYHRYFDKTTDNMMKKFEYCKKSLTKNPIFAQKIYTTMINDLVENVNDDNKSNSDSLTLYSRSFDLTSDRRIASKIYEEKKKRKISFDENELFASVKILRTNPEVCDLKEEFEISYQKRFQINLKELICYKLKDLDCKHLLFHMKDLSHIISDFLVCL